MSLIHSVYFILGGVIRRTEETLQRPLLWDVCFLHSNERPFVDFFKYCDGQGIIHKTTSPTYVGHIGINFKNKLTLKPIINFTTIPGTVYILGQ